MSKLVEKEEIVEELAVYLTESFGNETRIDYGTGLILKFMKLFHVSYK